VGSEMCIRDRLLAVQQVLSRGNKRKPVRAVTQSRVANYGSEARIV